nr:beta-amyrin 28-monooxygenase-like [Coffea arabica]
MAAGIFTLPINLPGSSYNRGIKAANSVRQKLLGIIKQRKGEVMDKQLVHDEDLLSLFLTKPDENGKFMSEPEIADHLLAALLASQDSTTASITFTMKYLAEFPDIYDEVLKEQRSIAQEKIPGEPLNWKDLQKMRYAWNVVSEVLRLVPPVQGNFREVLTDFTYSTFFIPKGWKIYWTPNSTHKNPQYFSDPEKFDPSRFEGSGPMPHTFVPFGGGSRICPGKDFARVVILVFMYNVIGKFRWEKLLPVEKTVVLPIPLPAKGLPVVLHPH